MDAPADTSLQQSRARRLEARIAELEAELEEQREAAAAARTLVADEARRRMEVERELHECRTHVIGVREASAYLVAAVARRRR
jgi:hypothetical protein